MEVVVRRGFSCAALFVIRWGRSDLPALKKLRQPKVQNLGFSPLRHKDVRRLDVAMDDAHGVGGFQPLGDLDRKIEQLIIL